MATPQLQAFIITCLQNMDPTLDVSDGSSAMINVVNPIVEYLGTDPFETDIQTFITNRLQQELPDIYNGDAGIVAEYFTHPLTLFLDPFKRELQSMRNGQSFANPTLLSSDDADSLAANFFEQRDQGNSSTGIARLYYNSPATVDVDTTIPFSTASGLNFFATTPISITSDEMVFNKEGVLYYFDVPLTAEQPGNQYNIGTGTAGIISVTGLFGVVKVLNKSPFSNGSPAQDIPTFIQSTEQGLTERSLVARRGATARIQEEFQGLVQSVQIIGANDPEMQRDFLTASASGHLWATGSVILFGTTSGLAIVQASILDGAATTVPVSGDTLLLYFDVPTYPSLLQSQRSTRLTVTQLIAGPLAPSSPSTSSIQAFYLVQWRGALPTTPVIPPSATAPTFFGGLIQQGTIQISSLPDGPPFATPLLLPDGEAHVFGHTDIYVRPSIPDLGSADLSTLSDNSPVCAGLYLQTTAGSNVVSDSTVPDFEALGVQAGDILTVLGSSNDAGPYMIGEVSGASLYLITGKNQGNVYGLNNTLTAPAGVQYVISSGIYVDVFEPKIVKLPFGTSSVNDLSVTIGLSLFTFSTVDLSLYNIQQGDVLRIYAPALNAGDYSIQSVVSGSQLQVSPTTPALASESTLSYTIFTPLQAVESPLVRLTSITATGSAITVPPADPIAVVPTGDLTSAKIKGASLRASGYVLPNMNDGVNPYVIGGDVPNGGGSVPPTSYTPYSSEVLTSAGTYKAVVFAGPITSEFDTRSNGTDSWDVNDADGACSWFLATAENLADSVNYPPIDPKPGDALSLYSGPNAGSYLIRQVVKFSYVITGGNTVWAYLLQVYGTFPVDVFRYLIDFINSQVPGTVPPINAQLTTTQFDQFFSDLYSNLGSNLQLALGNLGISPESVPSVAVLNDTIQTLTQTSYAWGEPAHGVLRSYFISPTVVELNTETDLDVSLFSLLNSVGGEVQFRPELGRYTQRQVFPARGAEDTDPLDYPRDMLLVSTLGATSTVGFTEESMFTAGIKPSDVLSVYEEEFLPATDPQYDKFHQLAVQTLSGSPVVSPLPSAGSPFSSAVIGDLLFIEEGPDIGGYVIQSVSTSSEGVTSITLDRALTTTTPAILANNNQATWGSGILASTSSGWTINPGDTLTINGTYTVTLFPGMPLTELANAIRALGIPALTAFVNMDDHVVSILYGGESLTFSGTGRIDLGLPTSASTTACVLVDPNWGVFSVYEGYYLSIYGIGNYEYQGSYQIASGSGEGAALLTVNGADGFPTYPAQFNSATDYARWAVFVSSTTPGPGMYSTTDGTALVGLQPVRVYNGNPENFSVESVVPTPEPYTTDPSPPSGSTVVVEGGGCIEDGWAQPYTFYRPNRRRVTQTEMQGNMDGPYYYFDTEVVSLSPGPEANISQGSYLTVDPGTYYSEGYRLTPVDPTLTFSTQEEAMLVLPLQVLPPGLADTPSSYVQLLGQPLVINYECSTSVIANVESFITSAEDRVTAANLLARHILPAYISYWATYSGGDSEGKVVSDIQSYIDTLPVEGVVEVAKIEKIIDSHGGDPVVPTKVSSLIQDWNRRWWLELSEDSIGNTTLVPYAGTPRILGFFSSQDVSGETVIPEGPSINLTQQ